VALRYEAASVVYRARAPTDARCFLRSSGVDGDLQRQTFCRVGAFDEAFCRDLGVQHRLQTLGSWSILTLRFSGRGDVICRGRAIISRGGDTHRSRTGDAALVVCAKGQGSGVVVASDPHPFAPGLHARNPRGDRVRQIERRTHIVKAITQTHHHGWVQTVDHLVQPHQCFGVIIWG